MSVFIFRRFLTLIATLVGASLIIFLVLDALPGNAAQMLMGADASPEAVRALTVKLGLDQPLHYRYLHWIGGLLIGDLGNSYAYGTPVAGSDRGAAGADHSAGDHGDADHGRAGAVGRHLYARPITTSSATSA